MKGEDINHFIRKYWPTSENDDTVIIDASHLASDEVQNFLMDEKYTRFKGVQRIAKLGNDNIIEIDKLLGNTYEVRYRVKPFGPSLRNVMFLYLACLVDKSKIDAYYIVSFEFEDKWDMNFFYQRQSSLYNIIQRKTKLCSIISGMGEVPAT